jgi:hypothetical protein
MSSRICLAGVALGTGLAFAAGAHAGPIPYPTAGTLDPVLCTFTATATATGDITAYFYGAAGASCTNVLTMLVNGVATGIQGLNNHTSAFGASLDLGAVRAGDEIVFEMINTSPGGNGPWYSKKSLNSGGVNHVYSTNYAGGSGIPVGTYAAFEDQAGGGDKNYNDLSFVFTNVSTSTNVPEPGSLALMLAAGLGLIAASRKARAA